MGLSSGTLADDEKFTKWKPSSHVGHAQDLQELCKEWSTADDAFALRPTSCESQNGLNPKTWQLPGQEPLHERRGNEVN